MKHLSYLLKYIFFHLLVIFIIFEGFTGFFLGETNIPNLVPFVAIFIILSQIVGFIALLFMVTRIEDQTLVKRIELKHKFSSGWSNHGFISFDFFLHLVITGLAAYGGFIGSAVILLIATICSTIVKGAKVAYIEALDESIGEDT